MKLLFIGVDQYVVCGWMVDLCDPADTKQTSCLQYVIHGIFFKDLQKAN